MEDFITVTMLASERLVIEAAAKKAGLTPSTYLLGLGLADAKKRTGRKLSDEELGRQKALIGAYTAALGYEPDKTQMGRVARVATALCKQAARNPADLPQVLARVREVVWRYRDPTVPVPLEVIAEHWPAWQAAQAKVPASPPPVAPTPLVTQGVPDLGLLFGETDEEIAF